MQMSSFGSMQMSIAPKKSDPGTYEVVLAAENRKEVLRMDLQKTESVDNFCRRLQSMLRGFMTAEVRVAEAPPAAKAAAAPAKSFKEAKAEMLPLGEIK